MPGALLARMRKHFSKFLTVEIGESERRAEALASTFGKVLLTTDVRINTSVGTYLCGADAIPFHTDHPDAEIIMWYCIEQDQTDGSQLLCDAWAAYNLLSLVAREKPDYAINGLQH